MKSSILFMITVAAVSTLPFGTSARAVDEPAGLVGRWDFDDGTGKDLSGNGNDAVLGGARAYSLGEGQGCIEIAPNAEPMRIPTSENSPLAIARGTISFWMSASTDRKGILEFDNGAVQLNNYRGCFQVRFAGENRFRFWNLVLDYDWPKYDLREFAFYPHIKASVGDAEWHLFTVAYDEEGKRIVGWRDGELIAAGLTDEVQWLLNHMESGEADENQPQVLKSSHLIAAIIRLLLKKEVVSEEELIEELKGR